MPRAQRRFTVTLSVAAVAIVVGVIVHAVVTESADLATTPPKQDDHESVRDEGRASSHGGRSPVETDRFRDEGKSRPSPNGVLAIRVVDESAEPVPSAELTPESAARPRDAAPTVAVDAEGGARVEVCSTGNVRVLCEAPGFDPSVTEVVPSTEESPVESTIVLTSLRTISGTLRWSDGSPIAGGKAALWSLVEGARGVAGRLGIGRQRRFTRAEAAVSADDSGRFRIRGPRHLGVHVQFDVSGLIAGTASYEFNAEDNALWVPGSQGDVDIGVVTFTEPYVAVLAVHDDGGVDARAWYCRSDEQPAPPPVRGPQASCIADLAPEGQSRVYWFEPPEDERDRLIVDRLIRYPAWPQPIPVKLLARPARKFTRADVTWLRLGRLTDPRQVIVTARGAKNGTRLGLAIRPLGTGGSSLFASGLDEVRLLLPSGRYRAHPAEVNRLHPSDIVFDRLQFEVLADRLGPVRVEIPEWRKLAVFKLEPIDEFGRPVPSWLVQAPNRKGPAFYPSHVDGLLRLPPARPFVLWARGLEPTAFTSPGADGAGSVPSIRVTVGHN